MSKRFSYKSTHILSIITTFLLSASIFMPFYTTACADNTKYPESKAECVVEQNTRRILYENHADVRLPMASTTKIITAITVLENCENIEQEITIPDEAVGVEGSSVYLQSGDVYSVKDLLYGLMLRSGNDCATALALYCSGSIDGFSAKMNETAEKAGALASNFRNPHGLPCENHYTTARDLSMITCYAMQNPIFRDIVATTHYQPRSWKNKNKMLMNFTGAIGVKTGYTKQAGRCLVSAAERDGMILVCTVLNSPSMYERSAALLNDAFDAYVNTKLLSKGDKFLLDDGKKKRWAYAREDFSCPLLEGEKQWVEIQVFPTENQVDGEIIGQIQISLAKRLLFLGNLYKL